MVLLESMMGRINWRAAQTGSYMEILSMGYLALPLAIFFIGWLKPVIAVLAMVILLACSVLYTKKVIQLDFRPEINFRKAGVVTAVTLMVGWVLLSGIGGITAQTSDFNKHNAVTSDLVSHKWPVVYNLPHGKQPLVYYVAYYLPAALAGKALHSVRVAHAVLLIWSIVGILLVFYWLSRLAGKSTILLALLFIGFSGMDVVGSIIMQTADNSYPLVTRGSELEWYSGLTNMQYSSNTTSLFWVPQHAIAGWLLAGMLAAIFIEKRSRAGAVFLGTLGILWSPFATLGLLPIYVCLFLTSRDGWRKAVTAGNILAAVVFVCILGLFFQSGSPQQLGTFLNYSYTHYSHLKMVAVLILFILLEFGIYALLLVRYVRQKESKEWLTLFYACATFLTVLPILRMGTFNDLVMRASIPSLAIISILTYRFLASHQTNLVLQRNQLLVGAVIGLGLVGPLVEFNIHLVGKRIDINTWHSIANTSLDPHQEEAMDQYRGDNQSLFFKKLANVDKHN